MHVKLIHEKRKDYKCSMCNYAAGTRQGLGYHVKSAHEHLRDVVCDECDYRTSHKHNLVFHMKVVHKKIKEYECSSCGHKCAELRGLRRHIEAKHGESTKEATKSDQRCCEVCGFKSSKSSELARHDDFVVCFPCLYAWTKSQN